MDSKETNPLVKNRKIICTNIPSELLDKNVAKSHFRRFGRVLRILIRPKSKSCIIEYEHPQYVDVAILNGGEYKGHVFNVDPYNKPAIKRKTRKETDPEWLPDFEIQQELDAMAGTGIGYTKNLYDLRPGEMLVDAKPLTKPKKPLRRSWKMEASKKLKSKKKITNVWTPEQLALLNVLKQPAETAEEKFKVLESRDKLIRARTKNLIDLTKTTATVGTCPDMCPEKERLMREVQHQVALYEQDQTGKGMNPLLAIKQYSRSSADQEVPLPHELRPVSVLQLTMGYFMHRIMNWCDMSDVNLAEWYHFLWDRTRSIRKDITQQELCSQGSVELLEECARFHIHCSARLVNEDPSTFDQKINTENLTKCLQTLKYMYHDLNLKGESCRNEAEFRAYIILLNLNDGNFMWEVQQLNTNIQKSPQVKFALKVYSAIDKNNYVQFFKLVHSTDYMNACILLRYFVQIRTNALSAILKCYSPRAPYTQFPVAELEKLLAFEDTESTADFLISYGLYLNAEQTHVILDRKNFQLPEIHYTLDRAIKVVESKRSASVGETVYGGSLPPQNFQNYTPSNSFDNNNILIITDMLSDIVKEADSIVASSHDELDVSSPIGLGPPHFYGGTKIEDNKDKTELPTTFWPTKPEGSSSFRNTGSSNSATFNNIQPDPSTSKQFGSNLPNVFKQPAPPKANIFDSQPPTQSIFSEKQTQKSNRFIPTKTSIFSEEEKPKPSIFGNHKSFSHTFCNYENPQQPTSFDSCKELESNIFMNQEKVYSRGFDDQVKLQPKIFDTKHFQDVPKPNTSTRQTDTNLVYGSSKLSHVLNKETNILSQRPKESFISSKGFDKSEESKHFFQKTQKQTSQNIFGGNFEPHINSNMVDKWESSINEEISKPKTPEKPIPNVEELYRLRQLQEEQQQEKLKREKELEMKTKMEMIKKQLEEENKRKEIEKKYQFEERKRIAINIEKERKIALEIKKNVENLQENLLLIIAENQKRERLKEIAGNIQKYKISLFMKKWLQKATMKKRKREAMEQNPIWLPLRTAKEEAQELFTGSQNATLLYINRYKMGKSFEVSLPDEIEIPKINISLLYEILLARYSKICQRLQKEMFWKITVLLPNFQEFKIGLNHVEDVLGKYFQWKDRYGNTTSIEQYTAGLGLTYAIEKKQGIHVVDNNTNGLIFITHEPNRMLFKRIQESLKKFPAHASIPVAVILMNSTTISVKSLDKLLIENYHISNHTISHCSFTNHSLIKIVEQSLIFLASSIQKPPPLELNTLQSFLQIHLTTELWKRISNHGNGNAKYKACLKLPFVTIHLYNEAVDRLKEIVIDQSCWDYPDFPDDFDKLRMDKGPDVLPCDFKYFPSFWKSDTYRILVTNKMNSLKLPSFEGTWPPISEKSLEQDVFEYCTKIFNSPQRIFYKLMAIILKDLPSTENFSQVKRVLWSQIVEAIAVEKLEETNFSLHYTEFNSKSLFQQIIVVYNYEKLRKHNCGEWFYLTNPIIEREVKQQYQKRRTEKRKLNFEIEDFTLDELEKTVKINDDEEMPIKTDIEDLKIFMCDLEESMEIHKKICTRFQKTIKHALDICN